MRRTVASFRAGMSAVEFAAAGLFLGSELHELVAGFVGVVEIELPFAVAADLGLLGGLPAVGDESLLGGVDVDDAEGHVIVDADRMLAGIGRDSQHVLNPVGPIR